LQEAAKTGTPIARQIARHRYLKYRREVEKAKLWLGLANFDSAVLGDGKSQHFADAKEFSEAAVLASLP